MMYIVSIYGDLNLLKQVETCSAIKSLIPVTITEPNGSKKIVDHKIEFVFCERNFDLAKAKFNELSKKLAELADRPCKSFYKDLAGSGIVAKYYLDDNSKFVILTQYNTV